MINWLFIPKYGYIASAWAHFCCYLSMVCISYFLGRKYYKIPYEIKRIAVYAIIPVVIYIIADWIDIKGIGSKLLMNTGFLMIYMFVIIMLERKNIKEMSIR